MRQLTSDVAGKVVESVVLDSSEGVAVHFTDGTSMALTARVSYDSVEIELATVIGDFDAHDAKSLGLITDAEYQQLVTDERAARQRRQDERDRDEFARLLARFGGQRG